ncbi:MAG TPA: VWA domain-containing protein [Pyrinomonadaceae bacterium]|jgi:Ca-activated chloride channel family protein|nr:VWA domain-containing protein [Pyrinomonadaceae bacterium]
MRYRQACKIIPAPSRPLALIAAAAFVLALLVFSRAGQAQQQPTPDGRPRRATTTTTQPQPAQQKPTPTPTPAPTRPVQPSIRVLDEAPPEMADPIGQEINEGDVVKVDTNLVNLNVRVIDRNNRPIGNLRQDDFKVYEDGVLQPVGFFSTEEVPISYGLAVDNSGSMRSQIDKVIEAGKILINTNKPSDETFLMRFIDSDKIETMQDFTSDKEKLSDGLDSMFIEGGQTAIIDAVYLAAERIASYKKGDDLSDRRRRALILVTDGEERGSYYPLEQLFAKLREEDVQIFVIGFVNELDKEGGIIKKSPKEKAVNLINRLAKETGGRAFFPNALSELNDIAREISGDLRTQYVIGYYPTNNVRDGSFRQIRVAVASPSGEKRIALTRTGRTATPQGAAPPTRSDTAKPTARPQTGARRTP